MLEAKGAKLGLVLLAVLLVVFASGPLAYGEDKTRVRLSLDWTPNTNHTGLYVAKELGYFAEEGLEVEIIQPERVTSILLTVRGRTDFGISHQESVTQARANRDIPVVSIATILQENASGFAAPAEKEIRTVQDFEHKRFGGWGVDLYDQIVRSVMKERGADPNTVEFADIGMTDFVTAAREGLADFFWIFYGWQGIRAEQEGLEFDYIPAPELSPTFDYYTPVVITSEQVVDNDPELATRFLTAAARGYRYAVDHPQKAADILLEHVPELDGQLVRESQKFLADIYLKDLDQWGFQREEVWRDFMDWMLDNDLIEQEIDLDRAFTNRFLPGTDD